jgi:hypothetical protein
MNNNHDPKKVIAKILHEEKHRQNEVTRLEQELYDALEKGEACDADSIFALVNELNIIDPPPEDDGEGATSVKPPPRKRKWIMPTRIAAACAVVLLLVQGVSVAMGGNFFGDVHQWGRNTFFWFVGIRAVDHDGVERIVATSQEYRTVAEFEQSTSIVLAIPKWMPDGVEVEAIVYTVEEGSREIYILYSDGVFLLIVFDVLLASYDFLSTTEYVIDGVKIIVTHESSVIMWEYNGNSYYLYLSDYICEYTAIIESINFK